jgi:hypothetical protein
MNGAVAWMVGMGLEFSLVSVAEAIGVDALLHSSGITPPPVSKIG